MARRKASSPVKLADALLDVLNRDLDRLQRIDDYHSGHQDEPYMPKTADAEYRFLAKRAISNWMPLLVSTPAQELFVDAFRPSRDVADDNFLSTPEWGHWQTSGLDSRQIAIHRAALAYGHSFALTEKQGQKVRTKGLSPLRTSALFEDVANDVGARAALTVLSFAQKDVRGRVKVWDAVHEYVMEYETGPRGRNWVTLSKNAHGAGQCPVTRFACTVDLEGRTIGVIEPMIALQNRVNQSVFDLLVAQTYASFKVRWVTGMAPPMRMRMLDAAGLETTDPDLAVQTVPVLDSEGNPIPANIDHNARRFLFAEDPSTKFGTMDETPLDGFIKSIEMSIRQLAAISQTPPHYLLGQIANLSAEALMAAETALSRKVTEFQYGFGESWEHVFRIAGILSGESASANDFAGEVIWRDMGQRSLAQYADALGKLADQLGIPPEELWSRIPGTTATELDKWRAAKKAADIDGRMADSLESAATFTRRDRNSVGNLEERV